MRDPDGILVHSQACLQNAMVHITVGRVFSDPDWKQRSTKPPPRSRHCWFAPAEPITPPGPPLSDRTPPPSPGARPHPGRHRQMQDLVAHRRDSHRRMRQAIPVRQRYRPASRRSPDRPGTEHRRGRHRRSGPDTKPQQVRSAPEIDSAIRGSLRRSRSATRVRINSTNVAFRAPTACSIPRATPAILAVASSQRPTSAAIVSIRAATRFGGLARRADPLRHGGDTGRLLIHRGGHRAGDGVDIADRSADRVHRRQRLASHRFDGADPLADVLAAAGGLLRQCLDLPGHDGEPSARLACPRRPRSSRSAPTGWSGWRSGRSAWQPHRSRRHSRPANRTCRGPTRSAPPRRACSPPHVPSGMRSREWPPPALERRRPRPASFRPHGPTRPRRRVRRQRSRLSHHAPHPTGSRPVRSWSAPNRSLPR